MCLLSKKVHDDSEHLVANRGGGDGADETVIWFVKADDLVIDG